MFRILLVIRSRLERNLFPKVISYNRFVEMEKEVAIPLALFIKKVILGKCTASASLTPLLYGYAGTRESISIRRSKE